MNRFCSANSVFAAATAFSILLLLTSCFWWNDSGTEFVTSTADWLPQDFEDSRGIVSVAYTNRRLMIDSDMQGQDAERGSGEILLDLNYFPGLEAKSPVDFSDAILKVKVWLPHTFVGPANAPNGVQVFAKDDAWRACYSEWINIETGGLYQISLLPGDSEGNIVTAGFDPARIRTLGIKFGMNSRNRDIFRGVIHVESVRVTPAIFFSPIPDLPDLPPDPLAFAERFAIQYDGFYRNGERSFVVGANCQLIAYGQNFGATAWFPYGNGVSKRGGFLRANLNLAVRAGVKLLRVGLLDDGRTALDENARVAGYTALFREDVRVLLDLAADMGFRIEFVLMDYQLAGMADVVEGVHLRGRDELFRDAATRTAFVADFLVPFLDEFGAHPGFFGVDLLNEPEWIISKEDGGAWEDVSDLSVKPEAPISGADFTAFVTDCVSVIRERAPDLFITVGVSVPFIGLVQDLGLDYLALHHYPWMGDFPEGLPELLPGIPWMLEEYPTRSTSLTLTDYLDCAVSIGAAGAMLWNLTPELDEFTFTHTERNQLLESLRNWVNNNN